MWQTFRDMIVAAGTNAPLVRKGVILSVVSAVLQGVTHALMFPLFASLFGEGGNPWAWVIAIAACVLAEAWVRFVDSNNEWLLYLDLADEMRVRLGNQLKQVPLEQLASRQTGDLNAVLSGNVSDVVGIASGTYRIVITTILAPIVTIAVSFFIDWRIAVALIVIFPCAVPLYRLMRRLAGRETRISAEAHADTASHIVEYTQGLAVLRATRQVGAQSKRLQASIARLRAVQTRGANLNTLPSIIMSGMVQLGIIAVVSYAIFLSFGGAVGAAAVMALAVASVRFSEPLSLFANFTAMLDFMEAGLARIRELLDIEPLPTLDGHAVIANADVEFNDVSFTYAGTDELVINNLSLTIPERSLTALVGSSGSGKTTLTKLLTRYADPQSGGITVGGVAIRTLSQAQLMAQFSVVFQDVYLFDDTVRNNIRLGRPDATDDEVEQAARAAYCHEFITRLPDGYDTGVGEIGGALSGGERQRISIARAILKDAPIVILDEPTSALDTESEVAVQRAIDSLVTDKTVIVIAHRLSTIVAADQIVVLENGAVAELGSHTELLDKGGRYSALWNAQQAVRSWRLNA